MKQTDDPDVIQFIEENNLSAISNGVVDVAWTDNIAGRSLLAYATGAEITQKLIDLGCDPNFSSAECGETPLHWAASEDRLEVVKVLVKNGADVNARTSGLTSGFSLAGPKSFKYLLQHVSDETKVEALMFSTANRRTENIRILLGEGVDPRAEFNGMSPLDVVSVHGDPKILEMLNQGIPKDE